MSTNFFQNFFKSSDIFHKISLKSTTIPHCFFKMFTNIFLKCSQSFSMAANFFTQFLQTIINLPQNYFKITFNLPENFFALFAKFLERNFKICPKN